MRPFAEVDARWSLAPGFTWNRFRGSEIIDESLARLRFLANERKDCGLILGARASGKSSLLEAFRRELLADPRPVVVVPGSRTLERTTYFRQMLEQMGAAARPGESASRCWVRLRNQLHQSAADGRPAILLIDDADLLDEGLLRDTLLLAHTPAGTLNCRPTVIAAARCLATATLRGLSAEVDLWIAMEPVVSGIPVSPHHNPASQVRRMAPSGPCHSFAAPVMLYAASRDAQGDQPPQRVLLREDRTDVH